MSYCYNYYIGYELDGKIYPWGPFDASGQIVPVISRSRSFASNLHDSFYNVPEEKVSEDLRNKFEYKNWNDDKVLDVKYLLVDDLPKENYIKRGYFLISDVKAYEDEQEPAFFDGFYDTIAPEMYAIKLQHELLFGKEAVEKRDEEYNEIIDHAASDYMYYAYPDYSSKEYEAFILREAVTMLENYRFPKEVKYVILETEG